MDTKTIQLAKDGDVEAVYKVTQFVYQQKSWGNEPIRESLADLGITRHQWQKMLQTRFSELKTSKKGN